MSAPFTAEQEAFFAVARVEMARAQADVARAKAEVEHWASAPGARPEFAPEAVAAAKHAGAKAAVEFWRRRLPWESGGVLQWIDSSGAYLTVAIPNPSGPWPPQQSRS